MSSGHMPAPSHSVRRHSRNKKSDPFLELPDDVKLATQPSPGSPKSENDQGDSLVMDLVHTPITMITFVLSLFLVDRQQRQWRLSQRAAEPSNFWHRLTGLPALDPQPYTPYQDPDSSAWQSTNRQDERLPIRKKHREIAKLEIEDAFKLRSRVLVALIAWTCFGLVALFYALGRLYSWLAA